MKNLYLIETNAFRDIVLHDTEEKIATVLYCKEAQDKDFTLKEVEDVSAGAVYFDIQDIEEMYDIDYNNPETPRIIETIENWEG